MTLIQAVTLGAVQGITEFLPISSTAHLILIPKLMGWDDPGLTFDVALHLGTLVALLIYFWKDWIDMLRHMVDYVRGEHKDPLAFYIVAATIPGAVAGVLLEKLAESKLRDLRVIAASMIVLALVLVLAEVLGRKEKEFQEITFTDAMTVGFAQALALIPGVSRSGVTITAGLFRGLDRDAAARFSFFLSTPLVAGAAAKKMWDISKTGLPPGESTAFLVGILVSAIVGLGVIHMLLRYLQSHSTYVFVFYRILVGVALCLAFWSGFR